MLVVLNHITPAPDNCRDFRSEALARVEVRDTSCPCQGLRSGQNSGVGSGGCTAHQADRSHRREALCSMPAQLAL